LTPRAARHQLALSVAEFAAALGVAPQTVRRWERDSAGASHRVPGRATMKLIETLLAASVEMRKSA